MHLDHIVFIVGDLDEAIQELKRAMSRAELEMERTVSALGTVHSQMLLLNPKEVDSSRMQRLREDIATQVDNLHDFLAAVEEVYSMNRATSNKF